jgi:RimJ/RimL family protein N-acetyltransferase
VSITLIPYHRDFLETLCAWRKDPVVRQYNPVEDLTPEAQHQRCSRLRSDFADCDEAEAFFWFIQSEEKIVGNITVKEINRRMLTAELGYGIAPEARGNGYATAAVRLVTQRAFGESPLRKLIAYVHEDNVASRRVLEKVGYTAEGLLREHYLINGMPVSEVIYGILRHEIGVHGNQT